MDASAIDRDALIEEHYRWWTWSASRSHVKLGPISVAWYPYGIDLVVLCRYPILRLGGVRY